MMRGEIGSEYWTRCTALDGVGTRSIEPAGFDTRYVLSGRTALDVVIADLQLTNKPKTAYLPSYCCHTMVEPFVARGIGVFFYNVRFSDSGIEIDFDEHNDCDIAYFLDYFGFVRTKTARIAAAQKSQGKAVIYDLTHSLFCSGIDFGNFDYLFGSYRKWFGVNAGFCSKRGLWQDFPVLRMNISYAQMRNDAFDTKAKFMRGAINDKGTFLASFLESEDWLENDYRNYAPDPKSLETLLTVNVQKIRTARRQNAEILINQINSIGSDILYSPYSLILDGDCPLFLPLCVNEKSRNDLRASMIQQSIYLPIHWPTSELHQRFGLSGSIYHTELSCVCDQRYTTQDMEAIAARIRSFLIKC